VFHFPIPARASLGCFVIFWLLWIPFRLINKCRSCYFDPQDAFEAAPTNDRFPKSAATATFAVFLTTYMDVMKLLITVAAASIAFGGNPKVAWQIVVAKSSAHLCRWQKV
jgi:hypothetical protein